MLRDDYGVTPFKGHLPLEMGTYPLTFERACLACSTQGRHLGLHLKGYPRTVAPIEAKWVRARVMSL